MLLHGPVLPREAHQLPIDAFISDIPEEANVGGERPIIIRRILLLGGQLEHIHVSRGGPCEDSQCGFDVLAVAGG